MRIAKLRARLGATGRAVSPFTPHPKRPRGMHRKGYFRLFSAMLDEEEKYFQIELATRKQREEAGEAAWENFRQQLNAT